MQIDGWNSLNETPEIDKICLMKAVIIARGNKQAEGTWNISEIVQGDIYEWKYLEEPQVEDISKEEVQNENNELKTDQ